MSLATRCTVCGTVFRVVQDQLKASEGQVRCGRCGEVFNALEGLFDLEGTSGPIPLARDISANEAPFHEAAPSPKVEAPSAKAEVVDAHDEIDEAAAVVETSDDARADTEADTQADARGESGFGRSRPRSRFDLEPVDSMVPDEALLLPQEPEASFMHAAQRKDQWQRPRARRSLLTLCVLLFVLLGTQIALHLRDRLATVWPFAAPALVSLCDLLGCSVDAPRTLDTVLVENSEIGRAHV